MEKQTRIINQKIMFTAILMVVGCLAFVSQMQAVTPPPDGCYPNFTTAEGCNALQSLTTGAGNTGVGWFALFGTSTGSFNTGIGGGALVLNNADSNTAVGAAALLLNTSGTQNTAVGTNALQNNASGSNNTAIGVTALQNSTGDFLTAVGAGAGTEPLILSNNIYLGDAGFPNDQNVISIGAIAASGTPYQLTFIGGIYGAQVSQANALPVYVDIDGHLGTMPVNGSARPLRMRGSDGARPQVTINEFQKQQKRIADLESTVARLAATVENQAAQIEKVSAQLEASRPAPRVAVNNQ
jgi:hypothetical protein